jgi:hypothetical protein
MRNLLFAVLMLVVLTGCVGPEAYRRPLESWGPPTSLEPLQSSSTPEQSERERLAKSITDPARQNIKQALLDRRVVPGMTSLEVFMALNGERSLRDTTTITDESGTRTVEFYSHGLIVWYNNRGVVTRVVQ